MNQMRGIQTVRETLQLETYPMDRAGIYYAVGDIVVFDVKGMEIPVRDVLDRSNRSMFWTPDEVVDEIEQYLARGMERARSIDPARALGWLSIVLGMTELLAPAAVARASGLGRNEDLVRMYGVRELVTGFGLLSQRRKAPWLWARVAGDALDLATIAAGPGPARNKGIAAAVVGLAGVADTAAAIRESRS